MSLCEKSSVYEQPSVYNQGGGGGGGEWTNGTATIGGKKYRTITNGSIEIMAENLEYLPPDCSVITSGNYNNSKEVCYWKYNSNYSKANGYPYGLFYTQTCLASINNNMSNGWHVPSKNELFGFASEFVENSNLIPLAATYKWTSQMGVEATDRIGFTAIPLGVPKGSSDTAFNNENTYTAFWSSTTRTSSTNHALHMGWGWTIESNDQTYSRLSVRLFRNVT